MLDALKAYAPAILEGVANALDNGALDGARFALVRRNRSITR